MHLCIALYSNFLPSNVHNTYETNIQTNQKRTVCESEANILKLTGIIIYMKWVRNKHAYKRSKSRLTNEQIYERANIDVV